MADLHYPVQAVTKYVQSSRVIPTLHQQIIFGLQQLRRGTSIYIKIEQESVPAKTDGQANEKRPTIDRRVNGYVGYAGSRS